MEDRDPARNDLSRKSLLYLFLCIPLFIGLTMTFAPDQIWVWMTIPRENIITAGTLITGFSVLGLWIVRINTRPETTTMEGGSDSIVTTIFASVGVFFISYWLWDLIFSAII